MGLYLENKLKQNKYELTVKLNLSSEQTYNFHHLVSTKLENYNYKIYRTGQDKSILYEKIKSRRKSINKCNKGRGI